MIQMPRSILLVLVLLIGDPAAGAELMPWSVDGGNLTLRFSGNVAASLGLKIAGRPDRDGDIAVEIPIGSQGSLEFLAPGGHFQKLLGGSLPLTEPLALKSSDGAMIETVLRLAPAPGHPPALQLIDATGASWLTLEYGHFEVSGERLEVKAMDIRLGAAFATAIGRPELGRLWVGGAELITIANRPVRAGTEAKGACTTPEWPTLPGNNADLELTRMDNVDQVFRSGGRVALAPSAYFRNVGSADLPWFGMFATPLSDPDHCFDAGDGTCEPYGNDQGGILVYALYRLLDGRLEQLGRSGAKHAFNSVNLNCSPCSSGRIVWQGCEDIYDVNLNSNRDFLGPRSEITAHTGVWQRSGSIFDQNGDGVCDHPNVPFFRSVRCMAPAADGFDRRLHVAESDLTTPGARYFVESWYVVRDDVNIFNSMGRREVSPTFSGSVWQFPVAAAFQQGPAIDELMQLPGEAGFTSKRTNTGEGRFQLVMRAKEIGGGRYRYELMLMNFDFDRQIDELNLPLPLGAQAANFTFQDGDDNPVNDWNVSTTGGELSWSAPPGTGLDWGSLYTFGFEASLPPVGGSVELIPREVGLPTSFTVTPALNLLDDVIHADGFEGQP